MWLLQSSTGAFLHRFSWITDDSLIGAIDYEWNFLVEWYTAYPAPRLPKAIHYTEGGPWFPDYRLKGTDYQQEWFAELKLYEATLAQPRLLCPYERFSTKEPKSPALPGYANSNEVWTWDMQPSHLAAIAAAPA